MASYLHLFLVFIAALGFTNATETVEDAAQIARGLIESTAVGTMATIYPPDHPQLAGQAFALQEYYASCHQNGSLTLIFMPISRHSKNILQSPAHAASLTVSTSPPRASRARVSLMGTVTIFPGEEGGDDDLRECYLKAHPDAKWWLPEKKDGPHTAHWARFDPQNIYFVGGFGDSHYIGPVPVKLYQDASPGLGPPLASELLSAAYLPPPLSLAGRLSVQPT